MLRKDDTLSILDISEEFIAAQKARSFQFGMLQLTTDESMVPRNPEALGEIRLLLYTIEDFRRDSDKTEGFGRGQVAGQVYEKVKKTLTLSVQQV